MNDKQAFILERSHFQQLVDTLRNCGYEVIGPTMRDGAIVYDDIATEADFPIGWTDEQEGGFYRLSQRADRALFGYTVSPQSWKRFLHPPEVRLWQAQRINGGFEIVPDEGDESPPYAFIGVRACELHAIEIQDRVFLQGAYVDPIYQKRRESAFIVAVNCGQAAKTCFCASLGTGPAVGAGYDLALTEVIDDEAHYFVIEAESECGIDILKQLPLRAATADEIARAQQIVTATAAHMGREINTTNLKETLYASSDDPHWQSVAQRCLACGNCTMVCPTCFCTTVEDVTDLTGDHAERRRVWDSCFTMDFSYIHGGSVRYSPEARYRQWLTHKMASWIDQFGTSGCVGCGRCITWCPVGIDITAEAKALQESQQKEVLE
jgi:formate hydrogenlyase subunit 6/NADH:ubiquinone oxidoreductase subunit I